MLSSGMFIAHGYAAYGIGLYLPIAQIIIGFILIFIGHITEKIKENDFIKEKFASTYNWVGLFSLFIGLWMASFWGFGLKSSFLDDPEAEIFIANALFVIISALSMYFGAKTDKKIFMNYGLTFLIIASYTILIILLQIFDGLPNCIAVLIFGLTLVGWAKVIKKNILKK